MQNTEQPTMLTVENHGMTHGSTTSGYFGLQLHNWKFVTLGSADEAMGAHRQQPFAIIAFTSEHFEAGKLTASRIIYIIREDERPMQGNTIFIALPNHTTEPFSDTVHLFGQVPVTYATIRECVARMLHERAAPPASALAEPTPQDKSRILVVDGDEAHATSVMNWLGQINATWVVDGVHLAEGAVVTYLSFDVVVMAAHFGTSMTGTTAVQLIRKDECERHVPVHRKVIVARWGVTSDGAATSDGAVTSDGNTITWDEATTIDAMRDDLVAALANRVEGRQCSEAELAERLSQLSCDSAWGPWPLRPREAP